MTGSSSYIFLPTLIGNPTDMVSLSLSSLHRIHAASAIGSNSPHNSLLHRSRYTLDKRDGSFNINTKSSYKRSERVGDDEGKDFYKFKLNENSRVRINVTNREFLLGPSLEIRLEKKGSSEKLRRTALAGGTAVFDRRLSKGNYTLRVSSNGESVPYRLTFRRTTDVFDPFN